MPASYLLLRRRPALAFRGDGKPAGPGVGRSRGDVRPGPAGVPVRVRRVQSQRRDGGPHRGRCVVGRGQLVAGHDARFEHQHLPDRQAEHHRRPESEQPPLRSRDRGLDRVLRQQRGLPGRSHRRWRRDLAGKLVRGQQRQRRVRQRDLPRLRRQRRRDDCLGGLQQRWQPAARSAFDRRRDDVEQRRPDHLDEPRSRAPKTTTRPIASSTTAARLSGATASRAWPATPTRATPAVRPSSSSGPRSPRPRKAARRRTCRRSGV